MAFNESLLEPIESTNRFDPSLLEPLGSSSETLNDPWSALRQPSPPSSLSPVTSTESLLPKASPSASDLQLSLQTPELVPGKDYEKSKAFGEKPLISAETIAKLIPEARTKETEFGKGLRERIPEIAASMTSPDALATLPVFAVPYLGQAYAAKLGAESVGTGAGELYEALKQHDPRAAGKASVDIAAGAAMLIPGAQKALEFRKAKAAVPEPVPKLVPADIGTVPAAELKTAPLEEPTAPPGNAPGETVSSDVATPSERVETIPTGEQTQAAPGKFEAVDKRLSDEIDRRGGIDKVAKSDAPEDTALMDEFQRNQSNWEHSISQEKAKSIPSMADKDILAGAKSMIDAIPELKPERDAYFDELQKRGLEPRLRSLFEPGIYDKLLKHTPAAPGERPDVLSVGPGAASPGDVPVEPPVSSTPEHNRPNGIVSSSTPTLSGIRDALFGLPAKAGELAHNVSLAIKGIAGKTLPRITDANPQVGEAGARYGSSRIAARPMAQVFTTTSLEGTGVDPVKFGAALTEDNLRSVREGFRGRATELLANGDSEGSAKASSAADKVSTIVGGKNSPFKTEEDYQSFLNEPSTKRAIAQHIQQWQEVIEPQYRSAQNIDPDVELPTRGQQTGARINLKAIQEDDTPVKAVEAMAASPRLTGTFKRKSPFGIRAKGTGILYESDYGEIIANTFEKQLEIANKNAFDETLVANKLAEIHRPGWNGTIDGKRAVSFPLKRGTRAIKTADGEILTASQAANIYVRADLANEYRTVSNVDPRMKIPVVTGLMNVLNRVQLAGLTDFTVHTSNLMTALFNNPTTGKLLVDSLLSTTGRADIPVTLVKTVLKSFQDNQKQIAELAEIGALRTATPHGNWSGRILQRIDKTTRLVLDDVYQGLVRDGVLKDSETNRREFVNQVGQYNKRLQPRLMGLLRESGVSPFITAGRTFNSMGIRQVAFKPGAEAVSGMAATQLRLNMLSKWVGATVLIGTLNYILTKDKDGGVLGRPGNPLGRVDFGINDKTGRPLGLPLLDLVGLGRGLRVTGIKGFSDSLRYGLPLQTALDAAGRDIINSQISPLAGPAIRTALTTTVGQAPAIGVARTAPVAPPGENQLAVNATAALRDANPVVASILDKIEGKTAAESMQRQLPRFTLQPGKPPEMMDKYPRIVAMAQGKSYIDDVIRRARPIPIEQRRKFVEESINKMPAEDREHARKEMERRKVFR